MLIVVRNYNSKLSMTLTNIFFNFNSKLPINLSQLNSQNSSFNCPSINLKIRISKSYLGLSQHTKYRILNTKGYRYRILLGYFSTSTQSRIDVDSTWILRRYQISTNFHVVSTYFFDVISLIEKSTSFPRTFFDVISVVEKSKLFPRTFFDIISMVETSTLFSRTFFDVISIVEISTLFLLNFFDVILMLE